MRARNKNRGHKWSSRVCLNVPATSFAHTHTFCVCPCPTPVSGLISNYAVKSQDWDFFAILRVTLFAPELLTFSEGGRFSIKLAPTAVPVPAPQLVKFSGSQSDTWLSLVWADESVNNSAPLDMWRGAGLAGRFNYLQKVSVWIRQRVRGPDTGLLKQPRQTRATEVLEWQRLGIKVSSPTPVALFSIDPPCQEEAYGINFQQAISVPTSAGISINFFNYFHLFPINSSDSGAVNCKLRFATQLLWHPQSSVQTTKLI